MRYIYIHKCVVTLIMDLDNLPDEILLNILVSMEFKELQNLCFSNKRISDICNDPNGYLWKIRLNHEYPCEGCELISPTKLSTRDMYIMTQTVKRMLIASLDIPNQVEGQTIQMIDSKSPINMLYVPEGPYYEVIPTIIIDSIEFLVPWATKKEIMELNKIYGSDNWTTDTKLLVETKPEDMNIPKIVREGRAKPIQVEDIDDIVSLYVGYKDGGHNYTLINDHTAFNESDISTFKSLGLVKVFKLDN